MEIHEFSAAKRKCLIISAMKNKVGLTLKLTSNKLYYLFKGGGGEELNTNQHSYKPSKYKPAHHSFPCNYVAEEVEWILVHNYDITPRFHYIDDFLTLDPPYSPSWKNHVDATFAVFRRARIRGRCWCSLGLTWTQSTKFLSFHEGQGHSQS